MIFRDKTNPYIEKQKAIFGLSGDVYVVNHQMESLESHKKLIPNSKATTIDYTEKEYIQFIEQQAIELERERERLSQFGEINLKEENQENESVGEPNE